MLQRRFDLVVFDWEGTLANPRAYPVGAILFPGVHTMLKALREAGYLLAVATGKSRQGLNQVLKECELTDFFDDTCCAEESAPKPEPAMLLALSESLSVEVTRMLMIGDTTFDLDMAARLGMSTVAVSYGLHSAAVLQARNPLYCAHNVVQLQDWLLSAH